MKIKLELIMDLDTNFENSLEAVKELEHHARLVIRFRWMAGNKICIKL